MVKQNPPRMVFTMNLKVWRDIFQAAKGCRGKRVPDRVEKKKCGANELTLKEIVIFLGNTVID